MYVTLLYVCLLENNYMDWTESTVQSHKIICHHPRFASYTDHTSDSFCCKFCRNASRL